jgi:predicted PurR-regulated permease PerM
MPSKPPISQDNPSGKSEFTAPARPGSSITTAAFVLLTIAALYFGRDIFVPFALAVLLGFMLAPPVNWLRRLSVPRMAAVVLVVTTTVALIAGISVLVGTQVVAIANNLPTYQSTMLEKIRTIRHSAPGGGVVDRTTTVIKEVSRELTEQNQEPETNKRTAKGQPKEPLSVRVIPPEQSPLDMASGVIGSALGPFASAGLVIVFVFFVLLSPSDLRDRLIRLSGGELHRTTEALSEAADRVGRYLLMQLVVNATYGIPLGIGLYLIGVPGAFLWALMATLLRFIPYLGPMIAAVFPLTMAFAVDPGWSMLLWAASLVVVLELISNNVIEPWLYGSSTGMSPMAVILSAIFWTLLWGPVGLVLATPVTVCLLVIGHYFPQLKFIEVLLGSEPVLSSGERLYQRLLGGHVEEAIDIAESEASSSSLVEFFDQTALPALRLAEDDRDDGLSKQNDKMVADGLLTLVQAMADNDNSTINTSPAPHWLGTPALCIAGRGELDAAAVAMLAHMLETRGIGARSASASDIALDAIGNVDLAGVEVVCLSYMMPNPKAYARFVCRRLKRRMPHLKIVLGTWNLSPEAGTAEQLAANVGADAAATSLAQVAKLIEDLIGQVAVTALPPPVLTEEDARLEALNASGALAADKQGFFDRVARNVAEAMDAPIGLVSLIDATCQLWKGASGLPPDLEEARQGTRETSVCTHVVAANAPIVVEDAARDRRFAHNPFLREQGIRFYAGVPLRTPSGHVIGSLCVIDKRPRTVSPHEIKLMQVIADEMMAELLQAAPSEPPVSNTVEMVRD